MNVYNVIILDESGSMSAIYDATLTGLNEVLNGIRKNQEEHPDQRHFVSVVTFEGCGMSGVSVRRDRVPISKVKPFTTEDYEPGGCTPLYDAMGKTLSDTERLIHTNDKVIASVITDGMENSSEEYSGKSIRSLVMRLREKGWIISYIGANQDSIEVAKELNIVNALNWDATPDGMEEMACAYMAHNSRVANCLASNEDISSMGNLFEEDV